MVKLPTKPSLDHLRSIGPEIRETAAGTVLFRIYRRSGTHPTLWNAFRYFGPVAHRFDHHLRGRSGQPRRQERGILYTALQGKTCLAEVFQSERAIDCITNAPWLVAFAIERSVRLLDLTGSWPTRAGASMAIASGPRAHARNWSQAIYDSFPEIEGLYYGSSMYANRPSVALYERAASALPPEPQANRALDDPALRPLVENAAEDFDYDLIVRKP